MGTSRDGPCIVPKALRRSTTLCDLLILHPKPKSPTLMLRNPQVSFSEPNFQEELARLKEADKKLGRSTCCGSSKAISCMVDSGL